MKKIIPLIVLACILLCTTSCKNEQKTITLSMWHNYGGQMQQTMDLLVDEFNGTIGKEQGILIDVMAISSSSEIERSLMTIADGGTLVPKMPDIFCGYPKLAMYLKERGLVADILEYFTAEELDQYIPEFLSEGMLPGGGLYVLPIAKSTEVLFLNKTIFDRFAQETGASHDSLATFEGIAKTAELYREWSGGKAFFIMDSPFNGALVGMRQLGGSLIKNQELNLSTPKYEYIFNTLCSPVNDGAFAVYDGYSSDLHKTGDVICSIGSSAGILFYGDTVTYSDNTSEKVEYEILPYPIFADGEKIALQRGGGFMVAKSTPEQERAATLFLKWLTSTKQNIAFISSTGYLPVTKKAFEDDLPLLLENMDEGNIKKMLGTVIDMRDNYTFFFAPHVQGIEEIETVYGEKIKSTCHQLQKDELPLDEALAHMRR